MSDFVRIMRGWTAICKANIDGECENCPLSGKTLCTVPVDSYTNEKIVETETIIENWLKDHPLPSTPTWIKWLSENGIIDSVEDGNVKLLPLAYYPMDEEIAKKLGELQDVRIR